MSSRLAIGPIKPFCWALDESAAETRRIRFWVAVDRLVNAWPAGVNLYNATATDDPLAPSAWAEAVIGLPEPISNHHCSRMSDRGI